MDDFCSLKKKKKQLNEDFCNILLEIFSVVCNFVTYLKFIQLLLCYCLLLVFDIHMHVWYFVVVLRYSSETVYRVVFSDDVPVETVYLMLVGCTNLVKFTN